MRNEFLMLIEILLTFGAVLFAYKKFGKMGLFIWIPISTILANIQVLLNVQIFGLVGTLGNVIYSSSFLATDILSENHSKEDAKKAVAIGFFSLIATTILMNFALQYQVLEDSMSKEMYNNVANIFKMMPRLAIASLVAFFVSQNHDVWAFEFWKSRFTGHKYLWIRNNASTIVSQLLDTGIFTLIAFWGNMPVNVMWQIFITTVLLKTLISLSDTPFVYWAVKIHKGNKQKNTDIIPESI